MGSEVDRPALLQRVRPASGPYGAYAAVIPQWFAALTKGDTVYVNGDGETSRDFCYIDNVVQANLLASYAAEDARDLVYNVAFGQRTTLNELFGLSVTRSSATSPKRRKPNRPTVISGRETYAIPWRTSPVRARCWAMSPNTMSVRLAPCG